MLNEIILHRANQRRRHVVDVHRHATFKCKIRHLFLRVLGEVPPAYSKGRER